MERTTDLGELDIEEVFAFYQHEYEEQADWKLIEHLQRQALVYTNIIEQLKGGRSAAIIRLTFEQLDLVLPGVLPNPNGNRLLNYAFDKLSKYKQGMIDFARTRGTAFVGTLSTEVGLAASIGVELGWSPAFQINFQSQAGVKRGR